MARIETWYKQDLKKPVAVRKLGEIFSQDALGNLIGVEVTSGGSNVTLSGSVTGYCILADGTTVPVSGSQSANKASIVLPQTAYSVPGPITVTIKNTDGSAITTLCACVGIVVRSRTGSQVSPGSTITDWTNQISAQLQAVQTAADNVGATVATPFDSTVAYVAGNYVTYNGNVYRFTTDHAAGEWNASHVSKTSAAQEISDLKSALKQSDNELFRLSGYLNQNYVKGRQRYVDAGVEKFTNQSRWISPARGEYIELKSGDMIVVHQSDRYHFRVCYSTDNKATWIMSNEQINRFKMQSDAVGWIPIITTTTATDEDVETILNEHVIEIIRNGVNLVGSANSNVNGVMEALNISPNSGFQIEAIKDGTTFNYVNTTATENGGTEKLFEISCVKDDVFRLTFDFQAMISPENFDDYYLIVREINENESSPLRSVAYKLSELQTAADFTVYYANTKKIIANVNLKRSSTTVSAGYYEETKYTITVIKVLEQNDVYTEAGEAWEV